MDYKEGDNLDLYTIRNQLNMGIPLNNLKLKVTDYARVSTEHINQKNSLQNQKEYFKEFIISNPNWTYIEGYVDDGITGTSDIKRQNFMQMIADAKQNKFDLIVTKEISRFSRNTLDSIKYTRELLSYGVAVLFVNDNINTALPDSELRLTIMASMAQDEIRRLSERVKFGMTRAIQKGHILGNNMLYGYRKDPNSKKLIIIDEEAKTVQRVYELYAIKKVSLSKIAKYLNFSNIKTIQGNDWSTSTISRMIENPKYKGFYCGKKTQITDYMTKKVKYLSKTEWITYEDKENIPPIVMDALWQQANDRLNSRKQAFKTRKTNKTIYKNNYVYSAKIFCKKDQSTFYRRNNNNQITWLCSTYIKKGKKNCNCQKIKEAEIDKILTISYTSTKLSTKKEKEKLIKEKNSIIIKKERLLDLNIEGLISKEEYKNKSKFLNKKLYKIEKLFTLYKNHKAEDLTAIILEKTKGENIKEQIIKQILEKIVVSSNKNTIYLDIFINFKIKEQLNLQKTYEFKRGYDTNSTKKHKVLYIVAFHYND